MLASPGGGRGRWGRGACLGLLLGVGHAGWTWAGAAIAGQWIWCEADRRHFADALAHEPQLVPGVLVATITVERERVVAHLALSPSYVGAPSGTALVVRFDDGFHALWSLADGEAARVAVGEKLAWILARAAAMGVRVAELQLDYDCPTRRLREWSLLLGELTAGVLRGRPVWITSLPAHMAVTQYGDWFRPVVTGHILQVFDVGPSPGVADAPRLAALARAQRMPFRLGIGAFERVRGPARIRATEHGRWLDVAGEFATDPSFRGLWVFPGGMPWVSGR